jgi:hypothetical protein
MDLKEIKSEVDLFGEILCKKFNCDVVNIELVYKNEICKDQKIKFSITK